MSHPKLSKVQSRVVPKGWGEEFWIANDDEICGKILKFAKGSKFSMHMHIKKLEYFYCLKGHLEITGINTEDSSQYTLYLNEGETIQIPRFCFHQIKALEESEIIEISTTHEDSDSYRVLPGDSQK